MANATPSKSTADAMGRYIKYVMIALGVVLAFLFFFLVRDYRALRRERVINAREMWLAAVLRNHGHLAPSDATAIRSWMTFDYVDKLFALPSDYLKDRLAITNPHYPQVTLSGYANADHVSVATFVVDVENAIQSYSASSTASSAEE